MFLVLEHAPSGNCVGWGIPFEIRELVAISQQAVTIKLKPKTIKWLVFMHTSDLRRVKPGRDGFVSPMRGEGHLNEHAANYVILYSDGTEECIPIRRRHHIGPFQGRWGENCFEAVAHRKPFPQKAHHEQSSKMWGWTQTRVVQPDGALDTQWVNWLRAWENTYTQKAIAGIRFEPISGVVIVSAISA
jgi:hypothetical protein